jgi:hypothetical protein
MFHHQGGLDQPRDASGRFRVSEVGLHRSDPRRRRACRTLVGQDLGQRVDFHRITDLGPGAVRLDVRQLRLVHPTVTERAADQLFLPDATWPAEGTAAVTITVHRAAADHGVHVITIGQRLVETLEDHHAGAFGAHVAGTVRVTEATTAIRRHHPAVRVREVDMRFENQVHATGHRQRALARAETLDREVHRGEPGGTGGVDRKTGATESEGERHAPSRGVSSAPHRHLEVDVAGVCEHLVLEVAHPLADEHRGA